MAKTKHEVTCIIKPDIDEDLKKALVDRFDEVVIDNGAEELESKDWGKRRLAYEIEKYHEGAYYIMAFAVENLESVDEFGRFSRVNNQVLRSMTVKLDK